MEQAGLVVVDTALWRRLPGCLAELV